MLDVTMKLAMKSELSCLYFIGYTFQKVYMFNNTRTLNSVIDSNGNSRNIETTTSNDGFFSINWEPDIIGQYTIDASFADSESYYLSPWCNII